jgi:hypothetical protein
MFAHLFTAVLRIRKGWITTTLCLTDSSRIIEFGALLVGVWLEPGFDRNGLSYLERLVPIFHTAMVAR